MSFTNFLTTIYNLKKQWIQSHLCDPLFLQTCEDLKSQSFDFSPLFSSSDPFIVIAEIKTASPSEGSLCLNDNIIQRALAYEQAKSSAISVLTEETYFNGHIQHLKFVHQKVQLPCLMKDFIIDSRQIFYAKIHGAQIILLIVALLTDEQLHTLYECALSLGLNVLIEIHDLNDWKRAEPLQPHLIGFNNRCLSDLSVDLNRSFQIIDSIDTTSPLISESGIHSIEQVCQLKNAGFDGILIGSALMKSPDYSLFLSHLTDRLRKDI